MSTLLRMAALMTGLSVASPLAASPLEDICHARARELSGFKGAAPRAETVQGRTRLRLSGSAAVGVTTQSGPPVAGAPGGHGVAAQERHERKRREKQDAAARNYRKIYDDCLRDR